MVAFLVPIPLVGIAALEVTWTFVGKCTGSGSSLNFGSLSAGAIAAGDLALYFDFGSGPNPPASVTPSGFTNGHDTEDDPGPTGYRAMISAKILTGSEGSVTGMNGAGDNRKIGAVFRPSTPVSAFAFNGQSNAIGDGNPSAQTIATSGASVNVLAYGHMANNPASSSISPRTTSPSMSEVAGTDTHHYAHYLAQLSGALSNITYDMDDEGGGNMLQSGYLTFT